MERKKVNKQADAILCADIHLREDTPVCRTDDYWQTQWKKIDFITELQKKHNCPVIHSGDLYDFWKPSPSLLSETVIHLPEQFLTIYGNHDLPQHNLELQHKSGIYNLYVNDALRVMDGVSWGQKVEDCEYSLKVGNRKILVWHVFTYTKKEHWISEMGAWSAAKILRKYPQYDLIVTGDHHKPFVEECDGRLLVNPGSLMRMDADQIDHKPRVYLWYADTNTVEPVYIPIETGVISREHLEIKEQRNNRIDAFVSQLNGDWAAGMSFEDNLKVFQSKNNIAESVMGLVNKAIEV